MKKKKLLLSILAGILAACTILTMAFFAVDAADVSTDTGQTAPDVAQTDSDASQDQTQNTTDASQPVDVQTDAAAQDTAQQDNPQQNTAPSQTGDAAQGDDEQGDATGDAQDIDPGTGQDTSQDADEEQQMNSAVWDLNGQQGTADRFVDFIAVVPQSGVVKYEIFCVKDETMEDPILSLSVADGSISASSSDPDSAKGGLSIGPKRRVLNLSGAKDFMMYCFYVQNGSATTEFNARITLPHTMNEILAVQSEVPSNYEQLPADYRTGVLSIIGYGFSSQTKVTNPKALIYAAKHDAVHEDAPDITYEPPAPKTPITFYFTFLAIALGALIVAWSAYTEHKKKKALSEAEVVRRDKKIEEANKRAKAIRDKKTAKDLDKMIMKIDYADVPRASVVGMMLDKSVRDRIRKVKEEDKIRQEEAKKKAEERKRLEEEERKPAFAKKAPAFANLSAKNAGNVTAEEQSIDFGQMIEPDKKEKLLPPWMEKKEQTGQIEQVKQTEEAKSSDNPQDNNKSNKTENESASDKDTESKPVPAWMKKTPEKEGKKNAFF